MSQAGCPTPPPSSIATPKRCNGVVQYRPSSKNVMLTFGWTLRNRAHRGRYTKTYIIANAQGCSRVVLQQYASRGCTPRNTRDRSTLSHAACQAEFWSKVLFGQSHSTSVFFNFWTRIEAQSNNNRTIFVGGPKLYIS